MKRILTLLTIIPLTTFCQNYCFSDRFTNSKFFSDEKIAIDTNVTYGVATDWRGVADTQKFNISYPKPTIDSLQYRPFIMLIHGGGFQTEDDFSNKNQWNKLCFILAKRGFVVATIDYRVGYIQINPEDDWKPKNERKLNTKVDTTAILAGYRAHQDGRAALRYFVKNAQRYGIDTNSIFIGGRSAGGDISLNIAYMTQEDEELFASSLNYLNCRKLLGSLDSSTNKIYAKYKIRGVINMWGPLPDTSFISLSEALNTPLIMFHGTDDNAVPYKKCSPPEHPFTRYGSYFIAKRFQHLGGCYELNTKLGGGHGEDFDNEFLADHTSSFFKSVLCNTCKSEEFESTITFKTKLGKIFSLTTLVNSTVLLFVIVIIIWTIKFIKRRRRKLTT